MMQAANRFGLYSEFLALKAIDLRSSSHPRLKVETIFCNLGWMTPEAVLKTVSFEADFFSKETDVPFSTILLVEDSFEVLKGD